MPEKKGYPQLAYQGIRETKASRIEQSRNSVQQYRWQFESGSFLWNLKLWREARELRVERYFCHNVSSIERRPRGHLCDNCIPEIIRKQYIITYWGGRREKSAWVEIVLWKGVNGDVFMSLPIHKFDFSFSAYLQKQRGRVEKFMIFSETLWGFVLNYEIHFRLMNKIFRKRTGGFSTFSACVQHLNFDLEIVNYICLLD